MIDGVGNQSKKLIDLKRELSDRCLSGENELRKKALEQRIKRCEAGRQVLFVKQVTDMQRKAHYEEIKQKFRVQQINAHPPKKTRQTKWIVTHGKTR